MSADKSQAAKRISTYLLGMSMTIAGVTLILVWFPSIADIAMLAAAMALTIGGLLVLYTLNK